MLELSVASAPAWVAAQGLNPARVPLACEPLPGGVSATVIAVTGDGVGLVAKQPRARLDVADVWEADVERLATEVAALRLLQELTPGAVPRVLAHDERNQIAAIELLPAGSRNWQAEIAAGRVHVELGGWAGATLGAWHARTLEVDFAAPEAAFERFEQLRLRPFHETVIERRPELAQRVRPYLDELRSTRRCLVDGDFAPKNVLLAEGRAWALDLEVAHVGNPVFDLGFFLSFVVLSAIRWPGLSAELRRLADGLLAAYAAAAGEVLAADGAAVTGHTACLMLARTDGKSPASFLDEPSRARARAVAVALLERPEDGLWAWT